MRENDSKIQTWQGWCGWYHAVAASLLGGPDVKRTWGDHLGERNTFHQNWATTDAFNSCSPKFSFLLEFLHEPCFTVGPDTGQGRVNINGGRDPADHEASPVAGGEQQVAPEPRHQPEVRHQIIATEAPASGASVRVIKRTNVTKEKVLSPPNLVIHFPPRSSSPCEGSTTFAGRLICLELSFEPDQRHMGNKQPIKTC